MREVDFVVEYAYGKGRSRGRRIARSDHYIERGSVPTLEGREPCRVPTHSSLSCCHRKRIRPATGRNVWPKSCRKRGWLWLKTPIQRRGRSSMRRRRLAG